MIVIAALTWPILERIPLVGGLEVSPHGISIALGVLLGAEVMRRSCLLYTSPSPRD